MSINNSFSSSTSSSTSSQIGPPKPTGMRIQLPDLGDDIDQNGKLSRSISSKTNDSNSELLPNKRIFKKMPKSRFFQPGSSSESSSENSNNSSPSGSPFKSGPPFKSGSPFKLGGLLNTSLQLSPEKNSLLNHSPLKRVISDMENGRLERSPNLNPSALERVISDMENRRLDRSTKSKKQKKLKDTTVKAATEIINSDNPVNQEAFSQKIIEEIIDVLPERKEHKKAMNNPIEVLHKDPSDWSPSKHKLFAAAFKDGGALVPLLILQTARSANKKSKKGDKDTWIIDLDHINHGDWGTGKTKKFGGFHRQKLTGDSPEKIKKEVTRLFVSPKTGVSIVQVEVDNPSRSSSEETPKTIKYSSVFPEGTTKKDIIKMYKSAECLSKIGTEALLKTNNGLILEAYFRESPLGECNFVRSLFPVMCLEKLSLTQKKEYQFVNGGKKYTQQEVFNFIAQVLSPEFNKGKLSPSPVKYKIRGDNWVIDIAKALNIEGLNSGILIEIRENDLPLELKEQLLFLANKRGYEKAGKRLSIEKFMGLTMKYNPIRTSTSSSSSSASNTSISGHKANRVLEFP